MHVVKPCIVAIHIVKCASVVKQHCSKILGKNCQSSSVHCKNKSCRICESGADYLCRKTQLRSLGKHLPSEKELQSQSLVIGYCSFVQNTRQSDCLLNTLDMLFLQSSSYWDVLLQHCHIDPSGAGLCALCGWTKTLYFR